MSRSVPLESAEGPRDLWSCGRPPSASARSTRAVLSHRRDRTNGRRIACHTRTKDSTNGIAPRGRPDRNLKGAPRRRRDADDQAAEESQHNNMVKKVDAMIRKAPNMSASTRGRFVPTALDPHRRSPRTSRTSWRNQAKGVQNHMVRLACRGGAVRLVMNCIATRAAFIKIRDGQRAHRRTCR